MAKNNIDLAVVLHDNSDYKDWLVELKERFYSHRLKAWLLVGLLLEVGTRH